MSLLAWQFDEYPQFHGDRTNLLVHIVAVPAFELATIALVASAVNRSPVAAAASAAVAVAAFAAQARGHAIEANAPVPFSGPRNALARIFAEQFVTFPRFVLSGGWARAYRSAGSRPADS
jgi:phage terminase small subunit